MQIEYHPVTITVQYKVVDNAHFFTSKDDFGLGLCVAHLNYQKARNEVDKQLTYLLWQNHKISQKPIVVIEQSGD